MADIICTSCTRYCAGRHAIIYVPDQDKSDPAQTRPPLARLCADCLARVVVRVFEPAGTNRLDA